MSQTHQVCKRINDTFVVKCVEQIQPETYLGLEISDFISAIIAFFSMLAASFAGYAAWKANKLSESEATANREHNILSVKPVVQLSYDLAGSDSYYACIFLGNVGIGPAQLIKITYFHDDGSHYCNWTYDDTIKKVLSSHGLKDDANICWTSIQKDAVLAVDESLDILSIEKSHGSPQRVLEVMKQLRIVVEYTDLYRSQVWVKDGYLVNKEVS